MKFRTVLATSALFATTLLASPMVHASTIATVPVHAMFAKTKMVKLTLINDSGSAIEVKAGDQVIKLDAGKPFEVKLPEGTRVVSNSTTATETPGKLIAEVSTAIDGATIHIK